MVLKRALDSVIARLVSPSPGREVWRTRLSSVLRERGLLLLYILFLFALSSGTFNAILEGSRLPANVLPIVRSRGVQSGAETILNFFTLLLGATGVYIAYSAARQPLRKRVSDLYILVGVMLIVIGTVVGVVILDLKT